MKVMVKLKKTELESETGEWITLKNDRFGLSIDKIWHACCFSKYYQMQEKRKPTKNNLRNHGSKKMNHVFLAHVVCQLVVSLILYFKAHVF